MNDPISTCDYIMMTWPNQPNNFAQQMPTILGINVVLAWSPMWAVVGLCWIIVDDIG